MSNIQGFQHFCSFQVLVGSAVFLKFQVLVGSAVFLNVT